MLQNLAHLFVVFLLFTLSPVFAGQPAPAVPSKLSAMCQRLLVNGGWVRPPTRARMTAIKGSVTEAGYTRTKNLDIALGESTEPTRFARTSRGLNELVRLDPHFPRAFFKRENLLGKKVLDLACGEGIAVEQLRREGVDIVGLDIFLTPYQMTKPYFVQANALETGFDDESFDIIYSAQGPFTYLTHQPETIEKLMKEAQRILKPGGVLRLSPVIYGKFLEHGARPEIDLANTIYTNLPEGLRLKSWPDKWWFIEADMENEGLARYWIEIEKTK